MLAINDYNTTQVLNLTKIMPMRDLLKCSAELYDLYIKEHIDLLNRSQEQLTLPIKATPPILPTCHDNNIVS